MQILVKSKLNFTMETTPFVAIMKNSGNFAEEPLNFLVCKQVIYIQNYMQH